MPVSQCERSISGLPAFITAVKLLDPDCPSFLRENHQILFWPTDKSALTAGPLRLRSGQAHRSRPAPGSEQKKGERHPLPLVKASLFKGLSLPQLLLLYFDALSALPLRNISLTVATKWFADGGVGTAPLKMVL
jgi:hypothetical protein